MQKSFRIALVNGKRYLDTSNPQKTAVYESGKVYSVIEKDARRLLRQKTFKGKHYFGRVSTKAPDCKPEDLAPEVYEGDVTGEGQEPEKVNSMDDVVEV